MKLSIRLLIVCILAFVTGVTEGQIVPNGYDWPDKQRSYWPTAEWVLAPLDEHGMDTQKMEMVNQLAEEDQHIRALLLIKDGMLVFESYYHGGAVDQSTEVWSVTKSFVSALIGIAMGQGYITSVDDLMTDYMEGYPGFGGLTLRHVLTHTTGLEWTEEGDEFIAWIASDDWIENAVLRECIHGNWIARDLKSVHLG